LQYIKIIGEEPLNYNNYQAKLLMTNN